MGLIVALGFWGFGLLWLVFAFATVIRVWPVPFNMGWWATTFPLGVFCINTIQIGKELESGFFKVVGTALSVVVILFWTVTFVGTVREIWHGEVFQVAYLDGWMRTYNTIVLFCLFCISSMLRTLVLLP